MNLKEPLDQPLGKKEISLGLAVLPMLIMGALVGVLHLWLEFDLKFVLLLSTIAVGITGYFLGFKLKRLLDDFADNIKKAVPVILILIAIGGIVGSWMYSGTVPYLIYLGLSALDPSYVLVTGFVVTALVSVFTGTSYGSAATSGVAFMGIGYSLGIPLEMVAGAVLSGAVLGDKVSPISDTTNICALASEITVYQHIRGMLPNVLISASIAIIGFLILGSTITPQTGDSNQVTEIITQLESIYSFNLFMLLPAVVVIVGGFKGYSPVVVMVSSSLVALIVGAISHDFPLVDGAQSMITGFSTTMIETDFVLSETLSTLLNRGGFEGMMSGAVLFTVLAIGFGSFMQTLGAFDRIMKALFSIIKSTFGFITTTFFAGATLNGVSGSGTFSILTIGQLFRGSFRERKIPLPVLSRSMENSMTLVESLMPWHVTGVYMAYTLQIDTLDYAPYALFNSAGIVMFFILTRLDIRRKKY
ncbi:MAG: NhaC family Na+:H+ antiporter [Flavobacteriaceae bacterium]|jgi:NhaC family Na+:H+ antiporter